MTSFACSRTLALGAVLFCSTLLFSCRPGKELTQNDINQKDSKTLVAKMEENALSFEWLSGKASTKATVDGKTNTFKTAFRIRKDSAIWVTLSLGGIEGARMVITPDSVKLINRQRKTYFLGDFDYINERLNTDLDFDMLQSLLVANPVIAVSEEDKVKSWIDSTYYTISNVKNRKLKKSAEKEKKMERLSRKEVYISQYWLDPETFKIVRFKLDDFNANHGLDATYSDFEPLDEQSFPGTASLFLQAEAHSSSVVLKFSKLKLNIPQNLPFKIPDSYDQIY